MSEVAAYLPTLEVGTSTPGFIFIAYSFRLCMIFGSHAASLVVSDLPLLNRVNALLSGLSINSCHTDETTNLPSTSTQESLQSIL